MTRDGPYLVPFEMSKGKKKKGKKKGFEGIRPKKEEKRAEESFWQLLQSITFFQMKVNTQANEGKHLIK